jgi:hypothetical protein
MFLLRKIVFEGKKLIKLVFIPKNISFLGAKRFAQSKEKQDPIILFPNLKNTFSTITFAE